MLSASRGVDADLSDTLGVVLKFGNIRDPAAMHALAVALNCQVHSIYPVSLTPELSRAERRGSEADHSAAAANHEEVTKRRRLE